MHCVPALLCQVALVLNKCTAVCLLECETLYLHRVTRRPEILSDRWENANSPRKDNPLKALKHSQSFERHNSSITIELLSTESNTLALVT